MTSPWCRLTANNPFVSVCNAILTLGQNHTRHGSSAECGQKLIKPMESLNRFTDKLESHLIGRLSGNVLKLLEYSILPHSNGVVLTLIYLQKHPKIQYFATYCNRTTVCFSMSISFSLVHQWRKNNVLLLVIHLITSDRIQCTFYDFNFIWYLVFGYQIVMCKFDPTFEPSNGIIKTVVHWDNG